MPVFEDNVPLAPHTTFGIGGRARLFTVAQSSDDLIEAIRWADGHDEPWFVLGSGANVLIGDLGFDGLVIQNRSNDAELLSGGDGEHVRLAAAGGASIADLIELTTSRGLSGLEHFVGIPSTLGGALWQNLHFLSADRKGTTFIGDIVESAVILHSGEIVHVDHDYFNFDYDFSTLHTCDDIVLEATLRLTPSDSQQLEQTMSANLEWRRRVHPENAVRNSAGSVFRKIDGVGAGRLIDAAGLKGRRVGNAEISRRHANYIINLGGASADDVRALITVAQEAVERESGHQLTPEISFVGEFG